MSSRESRRCPVGEFRGATNRRRRLLVCLASIAALLGAERADAHDFTSAFFELVERDAETVSVVAKLPRGREGTFPTILPRFPGDCEAATPPTGRTERDTFVRELAVRCPGGLRGREIRIEGLDPVVPEAIVALRLLDGDDRLLLVDANRPDFRFEAGPERARVELGRYVAFGVEHIWTGPDHLLFVFALLLAVRRKTSRREGRSLTARGFSAAGPGGGQLRALLATITAFTFAHSLTLAGAASGAITLPPRPVEVLIAASILLLAVELSAPDDAGRRWAVERPALVAFVFGLLHGFGFAGALAEIGLPENARLAALLLFNVGIEIGQIAFVLPWVVLGITLSFRFPISSAAERFAVLPLGALSAHWMMERIGVWIG